MAEEDPLDTLTKRIQFVIEQTSSNPSKLSLKAGLSRTHIGLMLKPRPGALTKRPTAEVIAKIAKAGGVNFEWLNAGVGPIARVEHDALVEAPVGEFLRWYYATPAIKQVVDGHADVTVGDLLRYREEPARGGEADPEQVYRHIRQLRLGPIGGTVGGEGAVSSAELTSMLEKEHERALGPETRKPAAAKPHKKER